MIRQALIGAALAALTTTASAGPAAPWRTYANVRFAYQVCYPADLLKPGPEAPNSDGRAFKAADGAHLEVWGSNNALDHSVASEAADDVSDFGEHGAQITYKVIKPHWFVLSGRHGDNVVYQRSLLVKDVFKEFRFEYPAKDAKTWDPVVAKIGGCFRSLSGPFTE